ncbi:uncharacterized protein [Setaria viridis]|uniref:DUF6598 domain-containing protein n=1 Tax=Setaria viridis TaxID=4556 RepID=A0A4U6UJD1_SETVI|nr:uncharacterized protein LOC117858225 isoform X1 [Setaria viridis]TKW16330.1 hypothetical protein SEVIR_5G293700v2 [Setaria viridis]
MESAAAAAAAAAMESASNGKGGDDPGSSEEDHGTGKEMEAQHGEEGSVTKKPRVEDEEAELLIVLKRFRKYWMEAFSEFYGPFEATTGPEVGPKRYTESGPPFRAMHYDALEVFALKVTEIKEGLEWPLRVFGLVAVRNSMDYKRNILFQRSKENCQIPPQRIPIWCLQVLERNCID